MSEPTGIVIRAEGYTKESRKVYCQECDYFDDHDSKLIGDPRHLFCHGVLKEVVTPETFYAPRKSRLEPSNPIKINCNNDCSFWTPRRSWWKRLFK